MDNYKSFESILYTVNETNFGNIALKLFRYQSVHNPVYAAYLRQLDIHPAQVSEVASIPFLPISFFKTKAVQTGNWLPETTFTSSTTTGTTPSVHRVKDLSFYLHHSKECFEYFFGPLGGYHFFALLPSYVERGNSSLVAMINFFVAESGSPFSGFYLNDHKKLLADIELARKDTTRKIIVWGVSFALLDLAEHMSPDLSDCIIFETGGMKGRRAEVTREQLHHTLKSAFGVPAINSEYGMTELFSQAYTRGQLSFSSPPWMRIFIREIGDPFTYNKPGQSGIINIIDLANFHSVAFIATDDAGVRFEDGNFLVQGRVDNSDIRGCNLLVE